MKQLHDPLVQNAWYRHDQWPTGDTWGTLHTRKSS